MVFLREFLGNVKPHFARAYNVISISLCIPIVHRNGFNNQGCLHFSKKIVDLERRFSMFGRLTFSPSSFKKGLRMRNNLPKGDFSENHHCG
ncbi:MAG: hypothetical protein KKD59_05695, partial [Acidobacteria bacterium]|nr:hypothetical protein [Acidobacteriota bacterium]